MGFFKKLRRRVKKLIPKEIRPYVPYIAAAIPGMGPFASTALKGYGMAANSFLTAAAAKGLTDDEADLKDILRTGTLAAAPQAIGRGLGQFGEKFGNAPMEGMGNRGILETLGNAASKGSESKYLNPDFSQSGNFGNTAKIVAAQGATDYGIKAAELNEDALADYNRQMLESGVDDKAGRRAAIRQIYANTGTWDMDEVDGMLDTYGYRTGGRVGYAIGDIVDTDQITEDLGRAGGAMVEGIGSIKQFHGDALDRTIDLLFNLPGPLKSAKEIIQILVERYGVDPRIAQRKIINRMSDANEGFGSQGPQGTPDEGYNPNIGIDSGAENYYENTPAMPGNLGDMGGNMDDMSGAYETYTPRDIEQELEDLEKEPFNPYYPYMGRPVPMPTPDIPFRRPVPMPTPDMPFREDMTNREYLMYGGRAGYNEGSEVGIELTDERKRKNKDRRTAIEKTLYDDEEGGDISMTDSVKDKILMSDDDYEEFDDSLTYAKKGYDMLYPEIEAQPIRELRLADGGSTSDRLMDRVKELQDEGMDFASAMAQAQKEMGASRRADGGSVDSLMERVKELQDEGMDFASAMAQAQKEMGASRRAEGGIMQMAMEDVDTKEFLYDAARDNFANDMFGKDYGDLSPEQIEEVDIIIKMELGKKQVAPQRMMAARGGIMDVNENMNINIPGVGDEDIDVNSMESIKGQTAGPDWYMDRLQHLEFLGYNYETAGEIAYDTDRYMNVIEMDIAPGPGEGDDDYATGGRVGKNQGGLMSMGGNEMDLRGGGFVPMGKAERADDVPARLSKNEFVMTADAVRAAGGGSVQKGADLMYDQMKQLEGQA